MNANAWLEGTWTELYPDITPDPEGLRKFFKQFSFPGGIPSHAAPETPGSINEGGELGYSLAHAYGAALDNPDLVVACVVGDGEAETGPLSGSWQAHTFLDPVSDGAVLPILNLNGWKIANPTILARIPDEDLTAYFRGLGYEPIVVDSARVDTTRSPCTRSSTVRCAGPSPRSTTSRPPRGHRPSAPPPGSPPVPPTSGRAGP